MCMEDYRIGRKLEHQVLNVTTGQQPFTLAPRADRVGLYFFADPSDVAQINFADFGGSVRLWESSSFVPARYFSLAELGRMITAGYIVTTNGGTVPVTVVETWLQDH